LNHPKLNNSGIVEESRVAQNWKTMRKRKFNRPGKKQKKKKRSISFIWWITSSKMAQSEFDGQRSEVDLPTVLLRLKLTASFRNVNCPP
jgi:macrodomain Ter protein organizer (MatP/YcbG family)